jgi:hypothetical protein
MSRVHTLHNPHQLARMSEEESDSYHEESDQENIFEIDTTPSSHILNQYANEFNQSFCHAHLLHRDTIVSTSFYYLTFPINFLFIDGERLDALGLSDQQHIRIEFIIDSSTPLIGTIQIRNISQYDPLTSTLSEMAIAWFLKLRFTEYLKEILFDFDPQVTFRSSVISDMMRNSNCTHHEAERALEVMKWDLNDALIYLMDQQTQTPPSPSVPLPPSSSHRSVDLPRNDVSGFDRENFQTNLIELQNFFPDVDLDSLLAVYQSTNYSYQDTLQILETVDLLVSHDVPSTDKTDSPLKKMKIEGSDSLTNSSPSSMAQVMNGILRESNHYSLNPIDLSHPNKFSLLLLLMEGEIITCGSRCLICNSQLTFPGLTHDPFAPLFCLSLCVCLSLVLTYAVLGILPEVCGHKLCVMSYEELGVGIDLPREILKSPLIIDLFISFFVAATCSSNQKRLDLMFPSSVRVYDDNHVERSFLILVTHSLVYSLFLLRSPRKQMRRHRRTTMLCSKWSLV